MLAIDKKAVRVLLIEDYKLVRVGLISVLEDHPEMQVVGEAENAEDGLELIKKLQPDVVLMDLGLPGMDGIQATRQVKSFDSNIKVIVLTSHNTEEEVLAALGSGANAYCLKDIPSDRLIEVIKSVNEGAAWLDSGIAQIALGIFNDKNHHSFSKNSQQYENLTDRELQVLRQMVEGKNNSEIALQLCVSVHTIKVQVSNILQKLAVHDRVQAAVKAITEGIVTLP